MAQRRNGNGNGRSKPGRFNNQIGPAFWAVILQTLFYVVSFSYTYGQQSKTNDITVASTEQVKKISEKNAEDQMALRERLVKVETIVSAIQVSIAGIDAKLDRVTVKSQR